MPALVSTVISFHSDALDATTSLLGQEIFDCGTSKARDSKGKLTLTSSSGADFTAHAPDSGSGDAERAPGCYSKVLPVSPWTCHKRVPGELPRYVSKLQAVYSQHAADIVAYQASMTGQARRHALAVQKYTTNANNSDKYEAIITTGSLQGRALPKHLKLRASSHCGEPMPTSGHESKCYCEKPWVSWPSELPSLGPGSHAVQKGEDEMQRICAKRDSLHLDKYPAQCLATGSVSLN